MIENLWPDFEKSDTPSSPKTIIDEAGAGLEKKTRGVVRFYRMHISVEGITVKTTYSLYCSATSYHFAFMVATFPVDKGYPVTLTVDQLGELVSHLVSSSILCNQRLTRVSPVKWCGIGLIVAFDVLHCLIHEFLLALPDCTANHIASVDAEPNLYLI